MSSPTLLPPEQYLEQKGVRQILEKIVTSLINERPDDVERHIINLLSPKTKTTGAIEKFPSYKTSQNSSPDGLTPFPTSHSFPAANRSVTGRRQSEISQAVLQKVGQGERRRAIYSKMTSSTTVDIKLIPKDEATFKSLDETVRKIDLLSFLEDEQRKQLINAMFSKTYQKGDIIIKQGDAPDNFYVVDSGMCYVVITKNDTDTRVATIAPGQYFGELALISGSTRAASVIASEITTVWAIDQTTYLALLKEGHSQKRLRYRQLLRKVEFLNNFDDYQILLIADALQAHHASANQKIIQQGDKGDEFFIILEGECSVSKPLTSGSDAELSVLKEGDYFGERALLTNEPRAATITAKTDCKLVKLDKTSFHRLLTPCNRAFQAGMKNYTPSSTCAATK